jgi:hypothetical protein
MKTEYLGHSILTPISNRRRILAPRTSEEEALFIARKYLENKTILEAKLANAVNGGRFLRQNMLDVVAAELSAKFNVATRNRKYVEQKLRDMKKEARKYLNMAKSTKVLETGEIVRKQNITEPIRVMMEAMAEDHLSFTRADSSWTELDFSDTTSKAEGSEAEDDYGGKSPNGINSDSVASTSSSSSIGMGSLASATNVLGIDTLLGAYFNQPMFAAMANSLSNACSSSINNEKSNNEIQNDIPGTPTLPTSAPRRVAATLPRRHPLRFRRQRQHHRYSCRSKIPESHILAAQSLQRLCETLLEIVPKAAKTFEDACKLQSEYFKQLQLQVSLASFASQVQQANNFRSLS